MDLWPEEKVVREILTLGLHRRSVHKRRRRRGGVHQRKRLAVVGIPRSPPRGSVGPQEHWRTVRRLPRGRHVVVLGVRRWGGVVVVVERGRGGGGGGAVARLVWERVQLLVDDRFRVARITFARAGTNQKFIFTLLNRISVFWESLKFEIWFGF